MVELCLEPAASASTATTQADRKSPDTAAAGAGGPSPEGDTSRSASRGPGDAGGIATLGLDLSQGQTVLGSRLRHVQSEPDDEEDGIVQLLDWDRNRGRADMPARAPLRRVTQPTRSASHTWGL